MTRNARIRLLVLCVVCLIIVPVVAEAQTAGHDTARPPGVMPATRDVEDRILPPWLSPWLPDSVPVSPPAGEDPVSQPPSDGRAAGGHQEEGD